jgi:membrane-bound lytic murein transglycosylase B
MAAIAALALAAPASAPLGGAAYAQSVGLSQAGLQAYLPRLRARALAAGVRPSTIDSVFPTLQFSARTVQLDQAQPGGTAGSTATPPFAPYRERHVNPALIAGGQRRYAANLSQLNAIGRRYGVTPVLLPAISTF